MFNECHVEEAAQTWFAELGYAVVGGPEIAPGSRALWKALDHRTIGLRGLIACY